MLKDKLRKLEEDVFGINNNNGLNNLDDVKNYLTKSQSYFSTLKDKIADATLNKKYDSIIKDATKMINNIDEIKKLNNTSNNNGNNEFSYDVNCLKKVYRYINPYFDELFVDDTNGSFKNTIIEYLHDELENVFREPEEKKFLSSWKDNFANLLKYIYDNRDKFTNPNDNMTFEPINRKAISKKKSTATKTKSTETTKKATTTRKKAKIEEPKKFDPFKGDPKYITPDLNTLN